MPTPNASKTIIINYPFRWKVWNSLPVNKGGNLSVKKTAAAVLTTISLNSLYHS